MWTTRSCHWVMFHISRLPIPRKLEVYSLFMFLWCGAVVLSCTLLKTFLPDKLNLAGLCSCLHIVPRWSFICKWLCDLRWELAVSQSIMSASPATPRTSLCNRCCSDSAVSRSTACKHKHPCSSPQHKGREGAFSSGGETPLLLTGPHSCSGGKGPSFG